jgi:hypothetical protein
MAARMKGRCHLYYGMASQPATQPQCKVVFLALEHEIALRYKLLHKCKR